MQKNNPDYVHPLFKNIYSNNNWSMTRAERFTFVSLLNELKPKVAIEVGTFMGGATEKLAIHCTKVYTLDIVNKANLLPDYKNINYIQGNSSDTLPELVNNINDSTEIVNFILIDADHTANGVKRDIENVLRLAPKEDIVILVHDSAMQQCREGILKVDYQQYSHVTYVDLDFITGVYNGVLKINKSLTGGFAIIYLSPTERSGGLEIYKSQEKLYTIVVLALKILIPLSFFKKVSYKIISFLK